MLHAGVANGGPGQVEPAQGGQLRQLGQSAIRDSARPAQLGQGRASSINAARIPRRRSGCCCRLRVVICLTARASRANLASPTVVVIEVENRANPAARSDALCRPASLVAGQRGQDGKALQDCKAASPSSVTAVFERSSSSPSFLSGARAQLPDRSLSCRSDRVPPQTRPAWRREACRHHRRGVGTAPRVEVPGRDRQHRRSLSRRRASRGRPVRWNFFQLRFRRARPASVIFVFRRSSSRSSVRLARYSTAASPIGVMVRSS